MRTTDGIGNANLCRNKMADRSVGSFVPALAVKESCLCVGFPARDERMSVGSWGKYLIKYLSAMPASWNFIATNSTKSFRRQRCERSAKTAGFFEDHQCRGRRQEKMLEMMAA